MLRDNLVGLIEPMRNSAGADPLALSIQKQASDDRSICLENPRPEGAETSLTENVTSPFQAEPAHHHHFGERTTQSSRGRIRQTLRRGRFGVSHMTISGLVLIRLAPLGTAACRSWVAAGCSVRESSGRPPTVFGGRLNRKTNLSR